MRIPFVAISLAVLLPAAAFCQSSASKPAFEIADVHVSARDTWVKTNENKMRSGIFNAGRYEIRRATMLDLIRIAYSVDEAQVFGGPAWLDYDRFEVIANAPPATSAANRRLMLQSLLADRFHLVVRPDSKPIPAWLLSVAKGGSKLKPAEGAGSTGCQDLIPPPTFSRDAPNLVEIRCSNVGLNTFLATLRGKTGNYFQNVPLVDVTGLEGFWDIDLQYPQPSTHLNAFIESLSKQLGLTLELKTAAQPVLSVESVAEQPTANPAGLTAALPPLSSPEFEVASIKPCDRTVLNATPSFLPGGRVADHCLGLMWLMKQNWNLANSQYPPGAPKWLTAEDAQLFDIEAKAPAHTLIDATGTEDPDALKAMMRALLVDRFKMALHYEDQPVDAYTLVAVKPKLTKADPSGRTGCKREYRGDNNGTEFSQRLVCTNITMAQFAEQIPVHYLDTFFPALDGTGIQGAWDFTLNYDIIVSLPAIFARLRGGDAGQASEPSKGLPFPAAIAKQLGLKMEMHKRPVHVLVIDHIEPKPTEN